jgi:phospholipid transport system substrate-binding protein
MSTPREFAKVYRRLHLRRLFRPLNLALGFLLLATAPRLAHALTADEAAVQKTLKTLVNAIRYSKDDVALKQLSLDGMGQNLMADSWPQMSDAQHKTFTKNLGRLLRGMSFTRGREIFQYLDAVLYSPATFEGNVAHCKSTVVIHRELKKKEMPIEWVLTKESGSWKVVDTIFLGEKTTQGIRDEQVLPLLKEGGIPKVMEALESQAQKMPPEGK